MLTKAVCIWLKNTVKTVTLLNICLLFNTCFYFNVLYSCQNWIFSIIAPVVSVRSILICWYADQETVLFINIENSAVLVFCENWFFTELIFLNYIIWNIEVFCNITYVLLISFKEFLSKGLNINVLSIEMWPRPFLAVVNLAHIDGCTIPAKPQRLSLKTLKAIMSPVQSM